ncbi:DUF3019 domain-containing protein [Aliidiomarina halalkaliphila]|uniref:DUF3019 domain-containing protein n=1 Tax=Aliidiomarina halalkaliphila TaxID=2593535 RepID=A0A552X0V3_9GAMM|nr:DUF3019 domain-containing protein [Aliidiomarina halalkaliphila]TRW48681.1 DUF3019 domain-containing protein [Aliidiomarina halalkaliphila]
MCSPSLRGCNIASSLLPAVLLLIASGTTESTDNQTEPCLAEACLSAKPEVCIVERADEVCLQELRVHWVTQEIQPVCLALGEHELQCWQNSDEGSYQGQFEWPRQGRLTLLNGYGDVIVYLEISTQSLRPRQRRRLGSPWSIF